VLAALALAALLPLAAPALLILYIRARFRGAGARVGTRVPAPLQRTPGVKTMSEAMELLKGVPFKSSVPTPAARAAYQLLDLVPAALNSSRATAGLVYPYPEVFEPVMVESADGTPICGLLAMQPGQAERPALMLVHGLFGSKNSYYIQALALRAYYGWGFHVFAIDLRNFGDSSRFSDAPTSWGYRESDDILAAAGYLEAFQRVSTVGVCGASMGATAAILAASRSRLDGPIAGGVVALNGYAVAGRATEQVSTVSGLSLESLVNWVAFRLMMGVKTLFGGPRPIGDLRSYTREVAAQYYEVSDEELYRKASPLNVVGDLEVPCLIVHSLDDQVVPVTEAYDMLAAAVDNPMVDALVVPSGGHVLYQIACAGWFYRSLETFFTYWAEFGPEEGRLSGASGTDTMDTFGNPNN
jgi:predicted alpha/beta-fold hydrolase